MSNSLSLSAVSNNSLTENEEKNMTTKELAQVLGVTPRTIQQVVDKLGLAKSISQVKIRGQMSYSFNQEQATAIKLELQNHSKIAKNGFDIMTVSNDLEGELLVQRAMAWQQAKIAELTAQNNQLQTRNNLLMHTQKTYTASEIAKELGLTSAQKLNQILKEKEIQYYRNGTWLPTSKYSDKEYYEIKQDVLDNGIVIYNSRFTQKGRDFILSLREKGEI